ncbi:ectonucleotide pyrophosphatase/phosphodiesterase family member 1 isoform X2 [Hydra vulgaris]|uniref:ectonucleotide pyrophosphatase/phosphodiesterase family member 1 isoform X2 n=1 Tax=Hydra vulgaris TaxID=6087 RepID=UPI001F5E412F|nr:ectonucleotide pyrophosphatase/phosphodiesterase family member 1 isoform X2 [Hydra vulgaris]
MDFDLIIFREGFLPIFLSLQKVVCKLNFYNLNFLLKHFQIIILLLLVYIQNHMVLWKTHFMIRYSMKHFFLVQNLKRIQNGGMVSRYGLLQRNKVISLLHFSGQDQMLKVKKKDQITGRCTTVFFLSSVPFLERIDQVVSWLKLDDKSRPSMTLLYFEEPDSAGHSYGPDSEEVNSAIKKTDEYFGILLEKLKSNKLTENLNIIVVSDHGMATENTSAIIYIDKILGGLHGLSVVGRNAGSMVYSDILKNISITCHKNVVVMKKDDYSIPVRMHFSNNRRIGDVIITPKIPWVLQVSNLSSPLIDKGYHGLDNIIPEMQNIFLASGPVFKSGFVSTPFANIEIYNLLASILKLKPAPNNGTFGSLNHLLLQPSTMEYSSLNKITYPFRLFPNDVNARKLLCKSCICPYCSKNIFNNITLFESNLNLSKKELISSQTKHFPYSLPYGGGDDSVCVLTQRSYITGYSTKLRIPLWVGYELLGKNLLININRSNCFRQDIRLLSNESSFCSSYSNSGFDRGHLAPSGDFNHNVDDEQDTNLLSNIAPQYPYFNRGIWQVLEDLVRNWTIHYGSIHVITGSIFDVDNNGIKDDINQAKQYLKNQLNGTAIPTHFYKILYKCSRPKNNGLCDTELDTLSFILPHNNSTICTTELEYIKFHVASIKDIELMTGTLFFANLPADYRARLVSRLHTKLW